MLHKKLAEVVEGRCLEVVLGASVGGDNRVAVGLVDLVEVSLPVAWRPVDTSTKPVAPTIGETTADLGSSRPDNLREMTPVFEQGIGGIEIGDTISGVEFKFVIVPEIRNHAAGIGDIVK